MSAFQGKVRNKSQARRNSKNYLFFKELVSKQDYSIQDTIEFKEKREQILKEYLENKI